MPNISQHELDVYADGLLLGEFRRAQAALSWNTAREAAAGITHETPEYQRLNQAVIDAAKKLPKRFKHFAEGV